MNKNKKILLIIIASILSIIVILAVAVGILEKREEKAREEAEELVIDYPFYPADFELNIYEEEEYQNLLRGRFLHYCNAYTNVTVSITKETAAEHGDELAFLVDYIYTIIEGDHEGYNACFSEQYYAAGKSKKEDFTMQQLHHIVLTKASREEVSENGVNYTKFSYVVEYQINKNNGTFRKDIGDGTRAQDLEITNREGAWRIDSITTENNAK